MTRPAPNQIQSGSGHNRQTHLSNQYHGETVKHLGSILSWASQDDARARDTKSPRLTMHIDSLLHLVFTRGAVLDGYAFELPNSMIMLDETGSPLRHFDEKTVERNKIETWASVTNF